MHPKFTSAGRAKGLLAYREKKHVRIYTKQMRANKRPADKQETKSDIVQDTDYEVDGFRCLICRICGSEISLE